MPKIDLLIGGSPCQGFSYAGKQLNFDDPRSKLFFEYARILNWLKKNNNLDIIFLLENVKMKKESQDVISSYLNVEPIEIDSALLSAQTRKRLYWTNIKDIQQPNDKEILLKDIIEDNVPVKQQYYRPKKISEKNSLCIEVGKAELNGHDFLKRVYSIEGKCPTLTAVCGGNQERKIAVSENTWRKLTPIEYERLQTLPDNYTAGISNSKRYKCIGNGWTVDVISHIFKNIK